MECAWNRSSCKSLRHSGWMASGNNLFSKTMLSKYSRVVKGTAVESLGTVAVATVMGLLWGKMQRNTTGPLTRPQSQSGSRARSRR